MPKLNDRERLGELEARQRKVTEELAAARRSIRDRYAAVVADLPVETVSEREFREILGHVVRLGGPTSIAMLKGVAPPPAVQHRCATDPAQPGH